MREIACQDRVQGRTQSEQVSPMNHKGLQILWLNKVQAAGKAGQDHPQTEDIRQRIAPCRRLSMGRHLGSGRLAGAQQTENRNTQPSPQGRLGHLPRQWQLNSSHFHGTREKRAFCSPSVSTISWKSCPTLDKAHAISTSAMVAACRAASAPFYSQHPTDAAKRHWPFSCAMILRRSATAWVPVGLTPLRSPRASTVRK